MHYAKNNIENQEIELINNIEESQRKLRDLSDIIKLLNEEEQSFLAARILEFEETFKKMQTIRHQKKYDEIIEELKSLKIILEQQYKIIDQYAHDAIAKKRMNSPNERDVFESSSEKSSLDINDSGIQYVSVQDPATADNENTFHSDNPQ